MIKSILQDGKKAASKDSMESARYRRIKLAVSLLTMPNELRQESNKLLQPSKKTAAVFVTLTESFSVTQVEQSLKRQVEEVRHHAHEARQAVHAIHRLHNILLA